MSSHDFTAEHFVPSRAAAAVVLGLTLVSAVCLRADVALGTPFRDGAVLQQQKPLLLWGTAAPGENVTAEFQTRTVNTVASSDGHWQMDLGVFQAMAKPAVLSVTGRNKVVVENVVVGDVWLCSGQSNMYFPVSATRDAQHEIDEATHPLIREFAPRVPPGTPAKDGFNFLIRSTLADTPRETFDGAWHICSPATVGDFTAAGYFFARELQRHRPEVPIGIIKATVGGSPIEAWISDAAYQADPALGFVARHWAEIRHSIKDTKGMRRQPSSLYNGLIHPLAPLAIAGFFWYQGESNVTESGEYPRLFATMIRQWRRDFRQGDLPFIFVQLPNFAGQGGAAGEEWPLQREAQATALTLPNVHLVVTIDIGDARLLHPTNKQEVGRRAALVALAEVDGEKIEDSGPVFNHATREGNAMRVTFSHAQGLHFTGDPARVFDLAGADGRFVPAQARLDGDAVIVSAAGLTEPTAVRCEWRNDPDALLVNQAGLPARPFRSSR